VRTPLLPVEEYLALGDDLPRLLNSQILRAIAVGSPSLFDALETARGNLSEAGHVRRKVLRYLIRMSTRPTPYGLFAGVSLAQWAEKTDISLADAPPITKTRPDMEWLLHLVLPLESKPEVFKHLSLVANPAILIRGGRAHLIERSPSGSGILEPRVSVRATDTVQRIMYACRHPIHYEELISRIMKNIPQATAIKLEALIAQLLQQGLLYTDLRPPLTTVNPVQYVMQKLAILPGTTDILHRLEDLSTRADIWDKSFSDQSATAYRCLAGLPEVNQRPSESTLQVDSTRLLGGRGLNKAIGKEAARAAEILLTVTPAPQGSASLSSYRAAFQARYGNSREVSLLELLDPNYGLGLPPTYSGASSTVPFLDSTKSALRHRTLMDMACRSLRERNLIVDLDDKTINRLRTWTPSITSAPVSLDICVFVGAKSATDIDQGRFQIVVGPNIGAMAAGKNLGRFAGILERPAQESLLSARQAEERCAPGKLWAELVYLPRKFRSANVSIRPAIREYEIVLGVTPGVPCDRVIPLDELVVGVKNDRFYLRWTARNVEILISSTHMLNYFNAPAICRFLSDIGRDGQPQLQSFDWGPAASFPVLPRVQVGRAVLAPAQWRIGAHLDREELDVNSAPSFRQALEHWRFRWNVPRFVYLTLNDNRLLLDLNSHAQIEELREEIRRLKGEKFLVLQEVLPGLEEAWLEGKEGHYMAEYVISLITSGERVQSERSLPADFSAVTTNPEYQRLALPGEDWLYLKLYCGRDVEEDVIAGPLREFSEQAVASGMADQYFFIRYSDPDAHLRLRFHGYPRRLTKYLIPEICAWATRLVREGISLRFSFDTYDREIERYGGTDGLLVAEKIFSLDSRTTCQILSLYAQHALRLDRSLMAVISLDDMLCGLGLDFQARLFWCRSHITLRHEDGPEYRKHKKALLPLLQNTKILSAEPGGVQILECLRARRQLISQLGNKLRSLAHDGLLSQPLDNIIQSLCHMHCNRLLGIDRAAEIKVLGFLLRTYNALDAISHAERLRHRKWDTDDRRA
jgi:thiopeptide-type bacteriocin biosynthesis protein